MSTETPGNESPRECDFFFFRKVIRIAVVLFFTVSFFTSRSQILKPLSADESLYLLMCSNSTGLQQGFGLNNGKAVSAFDFNFNLLVGNCGYSYSAMGGHKAFIGIGAMGFFQVQYGYGFTTKDHQLKLRSDWPMTILTEGETCFGKLLQNMSMGVYYEHPFNSKSDQDRLGVTIGVNFMALYFSTAKGSRRYPF
ncbi:hypothetical protein SDC9_58584 [bioreactor metagenome]|uniref:Uncharacterized protein n=1 Tax=bioreactor metagenome TaxID=1076179 RepID=A0A644X7U4_9ZZZZ